MTRYLISGAAGFIGYHLAHRLANIPGTEVIVVDNFTRGKPDEAWQRLCACFNVTKLNLDLCDPSAVKQLPLEVDIVYHFAALNGTQNFYEYPINVLAACTLPTMHLASHYCNSDKLGRFIYASTSEVYASTVASSGGPIPTPEEVPLGIADNTNPRWSYAISKLHGEVVTTQAMGGAKKPWTILRYHNAYGPRMGGMHVIPDFLTRMRQGIYELNGHSDTRSFCYIDDVIDATLAAVASPRCENQTFNIGSQHEVTILELAQTILQLANIEADINLRPSPKGSVPRRVPNIQKFQKYTGWVERWPLEEGLRKTMLDYCPELL